MIERKELIETLIQMNDLDELRLIKSVIDDKMKSLGLTIKYDLAKGDLVTVKSRSKNNEEGTIVKVNRTRAVVNINGTSWNVPFSMITKS